MELYAGCRAMHVVDSVDRRNWPASMTCKFFCFFFFEFIKGVLKMTNVFRLLGGNGTLSWSPIHSLAPPVSLMDLWLQQSLHRIYGRQRLLTRGRNRDNKYSTMLVQKIQRFSSPHSAVARREHPAARWRFVKTSRASATKRNQAV